MNSPDGRELTKTVASTAASYATRAVSLKVKVIAVLVVAASGIAALGAALLFAVLATDGGP